MCAERVERDHLISGTQLVTGWSCGIDSPTFG
jgi:predicted nucleotide-binding protein (sugar kinase/HSP70/actin superfamily)